MSKKDHRTAFANDPRFQARIAGSSLGTSPAPSPPPAPQQAKKQSKATTRARAVRDANMDGRSDSIHLDSGAGSISFLFPGAKLLGLNTMLRMHNADASSLKETWYQRIRAVTLENSEVLQLWQQVATYPLIVEEVYITGESLLLDNESVVGSCKPVIDALVRNGVIPDDNIKVLCQPLGFTERGPSPSLLIRFKRSPKPWGFIEDETISMARSSALA